jgi:uncharacterized membrane protein YqiK
MQVIGDRNVRVVPDVSVSGSANSGLLDGLMSMMMWNQASGNPMLTTPRSPNGTTNGATPEVIAASDGTIDSTKDPTNGADAS